MIFRKKGNNDQWKINDLIPKVINEKIIIVNRPENDKVVLTVEELEIILNRAYQIGRKDIIAKAHCNDADCFECAFGSAEKCLLKGK